ncbi:hypothetical protein TIFTF001_054743, partial [Ficus carica]
MVRDWGLGGELHGQGWLGIGAKAANSMGKTLWLAMRRRASMLDLDSGPASSPTHHWDRGAKTWVARHSGKTRQSVHSDRPTCAWASEDARAKGSQRGAWLRPSDRLRQTWAGLGIDHVGLPGRPWSGRATPGGGYGEEGLCGQVADYHADQQCKTQGQHMWLAVGEPRGLGTQESESVHFLLIEAIKRLGKWFPVIGLCALLFGHLGLSKDAGPCCHHGCRIVKVDPVTNWYQSPRLWLGSGARSRMNDLRERLARVEDFVGVPQSDGAESLAVQGEQQARTIASLREALQELSRTMTERFEMVVRNVESLA